MRTYDTEIVFRGHHDKLADQLADGILQHYLQHNPKADINIDVVGGEDTIFVTGNIKNTGKLDITEPVRSILKDLGYNSNMLIVDDSCQGSHANYKINEALTVYGYATNETDVYLPKTIIILQEIAREYEKLRKANTSFLPDGKVILKGNYKEGKLVSIKSLNINHQNNNSDDEKIYKVMENVCKKHNVDIEDYKINPYGEYTHGGFTRDTGLSGTKNNIDSYQGLGNNTDFPMSGKSIYGVRAGVYYARYLAKELLIERNLPWCEVKAEYEEGQIIPSNVTALSSNGELEFTDEEMKVILANFNPEGIVEKLDLINKKFIELASYGQIQD